MAAATPGWPGQRKSEDKPRLEVRTVTHLALPPVEIVAVAELVGGRDLEQFYCTGLEWDWGDGTRSYRESDCPPFAPGVKIDRFFSARHVYAVAGSYQVRVRLRHAERDVARAHMSVLVGDLLASRFE